MNVVEIDTSVTHTKKYYQTFVKCTSSGIAAKIVLLLLYIWQLFLFFHHITKLITATFQLDVR